MAAHVSPDGHISRYLSAQPELNTSLEYNADSGVLYDASLASHGSHARTALVSGAGMSRALAAKYAQFVGPGMLSGLMVAPKSVEHDSHKAPGTGLGGQLGRLADALRLGNKGTEMQWVGPVEVGEGERHHGMGTAMLEVDDGLKGEVGGAEASVVLAMKICGALASMGYDSKTVHNVGKLVRNNMMSADAPVEEKGMSFSGIPAAVEGMLDGLFKPWWPNKKRVRSVNFNSNEPVLLINDFGRCGGVKLGTIVSEVLDQLHGKHNVWPVRVYAGSFIQGDNAEGPEFSVTLLNVVNTDIGGPSMIQLLDHPCNTLGWNGCMRREVWNGRDLLERFEKEDEPTNKMQSLDLKDDAADEEVEELDDDGDETETEDSGQDKTPYSYDDPFEKREPVHHPSWEHSTKSESLIDLVKNQGSKDSPGPKPGDSPKSEEGSLDKGAEKKRRTESTSSEGFTFL